MAQNDILLIQNTHATLTEFDERFVAGARSNLITFNSSAQPVALSPGTSGQVLKSAGAAGDLYWDDLSAGHTQNTDTGTTAQIFSLDSDGFDVELKAEDANTLGIRTSGDVGYADLKIDALSLGTGATVDNIETTITDDDTHIPTSGAVKDYADGLLAANDAMVYKGVQDCSGNPNYPAADAGDTYKVSVAGKIGGASGPNVEVGDMLICTVDSSASGDHATVGSNWNIIQVNIDGAVTGPASSVSGNIATFNGVSGKIIQDSGTAIADLVADSLFDANTILKADSDNTPAALTVGEQTLVGRITSGVITALTATEVRTLLNVEDGADVTDATNVDAAGAVMEADFNAHTILYAVSDDTPVALTVADGSIVGRNGGNIDALDADTEVMPMLWRTDTAPTTPTSTGIAGQIYEDGNYLYICTATNTWKRVAVATNWT